MQRKTEGIFLRLMMENTLDRGEMETVMEMSRRIDAAMTRRIRARGAHTQEREDAESQQKWACPLTGGRKIGTI